MRHWGDPFGSRVCLRRIGDRPPHNGKEISMEAATPEARKLVPKKFLKRKGAV
ncbi:MAG: hypothetical protein HYT76_02755 [Deltaproteobacteria bacterium]|nr:hypothetical protein [Deltaproteobacteria bacterium]